MPDEEKSETDSSNKTKIESFCFYSHLPPSMLLQTIPVHYYETMTRFQGRKLTIQLIPFILLEPTFEISVQGDPDGDARMRNLPTEVKISGIFQPCLVHLFASFASLLGPVLRFDFYCFCFYIFQPCPVHLFAGPKLPILAGKIPLFTFRSLAQF